MRGSGLAAILFLGGDKMVATAGPAPTGGLGGSSGILIGDRLYSAVFLTIDNSLIPADKLSPTPSMQDGLALEAESDLRILGCEQIQAAGILLRLPQVAMATAQVLFQRFFFSKSFVKHSFEIVAMACINLASKIEEAPRRVRDVINVFHHLRQLRGKRLGDVEWSPTPLILDQNYINTKNQVIKAERRILKELGFCVHVKHPHKIIFMYLQVLECERNQTLVQTAWNYMNDSLRTSAFVRFKPETIACACIYLAARALQIVLPNRPHWFVVFGATEEEIQDICIATLKVYTQKKPNYEHVEKEVEKRKVALQEAKLKAKGLNPDGTPALSTVGGFSPGSKSCSPREIKTEDKTPGIQNPKPIKKELEERQMNANKSPYNGLRKENKPIRNSRSISRSRSRTRSRSHSPRRHYTRRSRSGTYSSRSRSRSHSHSASPRHRHNHTSPHLKPKPQREEAKMAVRHGHKRKKSRSRSKSPDGCDPAKRRRHDKEHQRDRHERSRSYERVHKGKHHSTAHSAHGRHHR